MARSVGGLILLSALSPAAGLAVEMALAWRFGVSAEVDAFRAASTFLVLGQQLLVVQVLPHILVPLFVELRTQGRAEHAWQATIHLMGMLLVLFGGLAGTAFLWPEPLVGALAPGLSGETAATAATMLRWFALGYLPLVAAGVAAGVLQANGIFWCTPVAQLTGHLMLVLAILVLGDAFGVRALIVGALAGPLVAVGLSWARLRRLKPAVPVERTAPVGLQPPALHRIVLLLLPLIGVFVLGQVVSILVLRAASHLAEGTLAALGYAYKLGMVVALVPGALTTVLFPRLAASHAGGGSTRLRHTSTDALRLVLFAGVPLSLLCFALREPLVELLLGRGAFDAHAARQVSRLFGLLLLGAPATMAYVVLEKTCYSMRRNWLPFAMQLAGTVVLALMLPEVAAHRGIEGVVLTLVAVAWSQAVVLSGLLGWRWRVVQAASAARLLAGTTLAALAAAWVAVQVRGIFVTPAPPWALWPTMAGGSAGLAVFLLAAWLFGLAEARQLFAFVRRRALLEEKRDGGTA
ncbi:MAG: oligosaccharide flippase family protein [Firmicutes bacterium]|nr:oligosaccharide flippase family protein [Bacillota bacterium]